MPIKIITDPIFRAEVIVIYAEKDKELVYRRIKKEKETTGDKYTLKEFSKLWDTAVGFVQPIKNKQYVVVFKDPLKLSTLCHEAFHVVFRVFETNGIVLSGDSEEAYAYYLDWLVNEIAKMIKKMQRLVDE